MHVICWDYYLLSANLPTDIGHKFRPLAEILVTFLQDSLMHEKTAVASQVIVNQNKSVLDQKDGAGDTSSYAVNKSLLEFCNIPTYSKKTATRNIKALTSCSSELLIARTDVFLDSPPEKRSYLKDAIGCLASVTDSSNAKKIFMSLLRKFQFKDGSHELVKVESQTDALAGEEQHNLSTREEDALRCVMMELASSFVEGAKEDLIYLIYTFAKDTLQNDDEIAISESYHTLSRILQEHDWFCSSGFAELIYLLLGLRSPVDIISLRSRFASFQSLMIHTLKIDSEVENSKWFLILNEIVLKLKDVQLSGYMTMDLLIVFSVSGYMTMEKAVEIFDELKERCLVYDGVVNSTFMDWFFNWGKEKEAMESYKSLLDWQFRMAPATCNVLLEVLLKYGKKKEAWDLFDQMLDNHTPPNFQAVNSETFTIMVNECFKLGKCDGALTTFTAIGHNLHVYETTMRWTIIVYITKGQRPTKCGPTGIC